MSVLKCKMCGGTLEVNENATTATCEYCGTEQTIPKVTDDVIGNLFNRANTLRLKSEFDKAEEIYNKIIETDSTQAEAYWGIILCKYGIEYVEDPKTFKRVPTCHRTSFEAITADEDYKLALQYADISQKTIYEAEAKAIDEIQKGILAICQNEKPYDVFICYKETDESGKRTTDSVIANDIYHQLTQEGFKVFYAAITLEDKLGLEYEPYIFAALNSAKVMLVIGSKPEYFTAVWVKNEWSRFMKLMKSDRSKLLIPCYKDMDAYELPKEFAHLQAQDMGKIGFINDVVRGIKKVVTKEESKAAVKETVVINSSGSSPDSLIKRGLIFLEDGEWERAEDYFEKALDINPESSDAYCGKLLTELKIKTKDELANSDIDFIQNANYRKAYRYGDTNQRKAFDELVNQFEYNKNEQIYSKASDILNYSTNELELEECKKLFRQIIGFKNAEELIGECDEKIKRIIFERKNGILNEIKAQLSSALNLYQLEECKKKLSSLEDIDGYEEIIQECEKRIGYEKQRYDYVKANGNIVTYNKYRQTNAVFDENEYIHDAIKSARNEYLASASGNGCALYILSLPVTIFGIISLFIWETKILAVLILALPIIASIIAQIITKKKITQNAYRSDFYEYIKSKVSYRKDKEGNDEAANGETRAYEAYKAFMEDARKKCESNESDFMNASKRVYICAGCGNEIRSDEKCSICGVNQKYTANELCSGKDLSEKIAYSVPQNYDFLQNYEEIISYDIHNVRLPVFRVQNKKKDVKQQVEHINGMTSNSFHYKVVLNSYNGDLKMNMIKCLKDNLNVGLKEAKEMVDNVPSVILETDDPDVVDRIKKVLDDCHASYDVKK